MKLKYNDFIFDLTDVSIRDIRNHYLDYRLYCGGVSSFSADILNDYITEAFQKHFTVDIDIVRKSLNDKYLFADFQFGIKLSNDVKYAIIIADVGDNLKMINKDMERYGYFFSHCKEFKLHGMDWIALQFEPYVQDNVNYIVRNNMKFVYHITPVSNLKSILKTGLKPKSKNFEFKYPERLFFVKDNVSEEMRDLLSKKLMKNNKKYDKKGYCELKIDVSKIPDNVDFFNDPLYEYGLYCEDKIPKDAIVDVRYIDE